MAFRISDRNLSATLVNHDLGRFHVGDQALQGRALHVRPGEPAIVVVLGEPYQRFDADWVSFADDSPATPAAADMTA